jgi:GNAT superfamily N-acetyltransferase
LIKPKALNVIAKMKTAMTERFKFSSPNDFEDYRKRAGEIADAAWAKFMLNDPVAGEYWDNLFSRFEDYQFALWDNEQNRMAVMANSLPFYWDKPLEELPEGGWDWVFVKAVEDNEKGIAPNIQSAIQIAIHPDYQGHKLSTKMVLKMREIGQSKGFQSLVAPVRPSQKSQYPLTRIDSYITWKTEEGLPFDAWLRVHARLGARIIKPCHESMVIRGTIAEWEEWTNLKFPESGQYQVPGALNPIDVNVEKNEAIYIEPNVWMTHTIG